MTVSINCVCSVNCKSLTGRIAVPHRADAGKFGSWSWTESNFHPDDVMDSSYNDPSYKPAYTLDGYSANIIETGEYIDTDSAYYSVR